MKITFQVLTSRVVCFTFGILGWRCRLYIETFIACESVFRPSSKKAIVWALKEIFEEYPDSIKIETVKGDGIVVVAIGLTEGDGSCGVEVGDYEVLQLGR